MKKKILSMILAVAVAVGLTPLKAGASPVAVTAATAAELKTYLESTTPHSITITTNGLNLTGTVVLGAAHGIVLDNITLTISARISGFGSLAVGDKGTLLLTGLNSYSGGTILDGGVLSATVIPGDFTIMNGTAVISTVVGGTVTHNGGTINGNATSGNPCICAFCRVPVTGISGVPTLATAGTPLILSGVISPLTATNKTIVWSVLNAGTTGATIEGSIMETTAPGMVTITATIANGTAAGDFIASFNIVVSAPLFMPVSNITDVPTAATARTPLVLTGTVLPAIATNKTIVWSVMNAGETGATISGGNTFNATAAGTATIRATIAGGGVAGSDYTQMFNITVAAAPFVAVTDITSDMPRVKTITTPLILTGTVVPANATNTTIIWSIHNAGQTGAIITGGNMLSTIAPGTVVVRATVTNGTSATADFTKDFAIEVNASGLLNPFETDALKKAITDAVERNDGSGINVTMRNYTTIPPDILKTIQGKNVNLELDFGTNGTVRINGNDITAALTNSALDLRIQLQTSSGEIADYKIPPATISAKAANLPVGRLKLGAGASVVVSGSALVHMSSAYAGQNAVLASYNPTNNRFEFVSAARIAANGSARLDFHATGDYVVIIQRTGDVNGNGKVEVADAMMLLQASVGTITLDSIQTYIANGGRAYTVSVNDALNVLKLVIGIIDRI